VCDEAVTDERGSRTRQSYDRIAGRFLERTRDRTPMQAALDRFAALLAPDALVLDVGAGPGADAAALRARGLRVVSVDLSLGMLRAGTDEFPGPRVQADMLRLPFRPAAQGLWVNASLLHLPHDTVPLALREFRRVLQPPAVLHLSVKRGTSGQWDESKYGPEHPRWFSYWQPEAFDAVLAAEGLRVIDARTVEGTQDTWLQRIVSWEDQGKEGAP
jgi:ubiquinone/menaquinone biosynthesis C-methylase UbiE